MVTDKPLHPSSFEAEIRPGTNPMRSYVPFISPSHLVREKAFRMAIRTGWMPDFNLIWESQRQQGFSMCFGSPSESCDRNCRWFEKCRELVSEPVDTLLPTPAFKTPR